MMDLSDFQRTPLKENNAPACPDSASSKYSASKRAAGSYMSTNPGLSALRESNYKISRVTGLPSFASNSISLDMDITQAKMEHLEKDRIELSMQLHRRDEKDRERKIKLEQMEAHLKIVENNRNQLQSHLDKLRDEHSTLKYDKKQLEQEVQELKSKALSASQNEAENFWNKMTALSRELRRAEDNVQSLQSANDSLNEAKEKLLEKNERLTSDFVLCENQIKSLQGELERTQEDLQQAAAQADAVSSENAMFSKEVVVMQQALEQLRREHEADKSSLDAQIQELTKENEELKARIQQLENVQTVLNEAAQSNNIATSDVNAELMRTISELKEKLNASEKNRKSLHNKLQDLRGNVRVYVRCRPFTSFDGESCSFQNTLLQCHKDQTTLSMGNPQAANSSSNNIQLQQHFAFDRVYNMETTQEDVYNDVSELVQSALDGYRVCIFSYGQTGSGKTHTMTGNVSSAEGRGIIPRSMESIISQSIAMRDAGWDLSINVSIVELYNEELRDLLVSTGSSSTTAAGSKFKITKEPRTGRVVVSGLATVSILNGKEHTGDEYSLAAGMQRFQSVLEQSAQVRSTARTDMNETSSRSHQIVMIDISGTHVDGATCMEGGLRLCDLAGSERLDRTGTLHDHARLRETVNINKSLSCLADVFVAMGNKLSHIPYRNSKLTQLLQDCLSGDGKALMVVNVSPTIDSSHETLCSLRFANQVSQVEMGKASKFMYTLAPTAPTPTAMNDDTENGGITQTGSSGRVGRSMNRNRRTSVLHSSHSSSFSSISVPLENQTASMDSEDRCPSPAGTVSTMDTASVGGESVRTARSAPATSRSCSPRPTDRTGNTRGARPRKSIMPKQAHTESDLNFVTSNCPHSFLAAPVTTFVSQSAGTPSRGNSPVRSIRPTKVLKKTTSFTEGIASETTRAASQPPSRTRPSSLRQATLLLMQQQQQGGDSQNENSTATGRNGLPPPQRHLAAPAQRKRAGNVSQQQSSTRATRSNSTWR